jgi:hypothetical protein
MLIFTHIELQLVLPYKLAYKFSSPISSLILPQAELDLAGLIKLQGLVFNMHSSDAKNNLQLMACLLQYELQLVFFP